MSEDALKDDTIVTETEFAEPPETVWRALTDPALVEKWLGGGELVPANREVVEATPERSLKVVWRGPEIESEVGFQLTETREGGTRLRVVHDGFRIPVRSELRWAA